MDELPTELLAWIADRCDITSLKSLRVVNKAWLDLCNPLLFEHIYVGLFDHSLSKFRALSRSALANHVKKLTFYCDVIPSFNKIHLLQQRGKIVDREWEAYQDLLCEQKRWKHSVHGKIFQESMLRLRNVKDVRAIKTMRGDINANEWPLWKRIMKQQGCIVGPDPWKNRAHSESLSFHANETDARAALALLEAMGERVTHEMTPVSLLQLQLYCRNFYFAEPLDHEGFAQPIPLEWTNTIKPKIRTVFANLTNLSLYLATPGQWDEFGGILADFSDFMLNSRRLRRLNFWFEYFEDFSGDWPDAALLYTDQIGFFSNTGIVWPEIEHLSLKVNAPSDKLINFLSIHAGTLKALELRHMLVKDGPLLLEGIPRVLKLDHVYIQGLWHYGPGLPHEHVDDQTNVCLLGYGTDCHRVYENWMKKYLLRQTDRMPDLRDDPLVRTKSRHGMNLVDYEPLFLDYTTHFDCSSIASDES